MKAEYHLTHKFQIFVVRPTYENVLLKINTFLLSIMEFYSFNHKMLRWSSQHDGKKIV